MKKILAALLVVASLTAIAVDSDIEYYKQFLFAEENASDDPDFPEYQYRFLMSEDIGAKFVGADGKTRLAQMDVALYDNGTYRMKYRESVIMANGGFYQETCKDMSGTWAVPADRLEFDKTLMFGARHFSDQRNKVKVNLAQTIKSPEVKNLNIILDYGYSNAPVEILFKCFPF